MKEWQISNILDMLQKETIVVYLKSIYRIQNIMLPWRDLRFEYKDSLVLNRTLNCLQQWSDLPSYCSMGFAGYITVYVQLHCVNCHCLTLHVSACMAIFKCVVYFYSYFHMLEGICFAVFLPSFHVVTLHTFPSVGWVKYEVLLLLFMQLLVLFYIYVFYLLVFFFVNFLVSCVCVCLLVFSLLFVCSVLLSVVYFV
jgi:hypothetical protein